MNAYYSSVFAIVLYCGVSTSLCGAQTAPSPSPSPQGTVQETTDVSPDYDATLSPDLWFSLEDEFSPSYDALRGSSNTINLRGQIPLGKLGQELPGLLVPGKLQLIKFKIPFVTSAPSNAIKGNGDTTLYALQYLGVKTRKWVFGPIFKIPTASSAELGSGKWSIGPAAGYTYTHGSTAIGLYQESYVSFAGPKSRAPVAETKIQPGLFFTLPGDWVVGTSQMKFTYNWETNRWQDVPIGFSIERDTEGGYHELSIGFEAEANLARVRNNVQWTFRLIFKYRRLTR